jgi:hypothetical protein
VSVLPELDPDDWKATITRDGPWTWGIWPARGLSGMTCGYTAFGSYARAERKARRILARLRRQDARLANQKVVS